MFFKFEKFIKKNWAMLFVLLMVIGLGIYLSNDKIDDDKVEVKVTYNIGSLTTTGKYKESDKSLYTKDLFECEGLNIELDFDANIEYEIYFYDENEDFLICSDKLTDNFKDEIPTNAKYARLVIYPVFDDDVKNPHVSFVNVIFQTYSKQLKIFVDKVEEVDE